MTKRYFSTFLVCALVFLSGCTELELGSHLAKTWGHTPDDVGDFKVGNPYKIKGQVYVPNEKYEYMETGVASWYGPGFHGKKTANGETFYRTDLTAAHRTLQMPSIIRVTNLNNGRSLILRVNDRGPFSKDRILDVSEKAAEILGFKNNGTTRIKLVVLEKESRIVARAARQGQSTRGTAVALNRNQSIGDLHDGVPPPTAKPFRMVSNTQSLPDQITQPNISTSRFEQQVLNKVVTKPMPDVINDVFVQVGAFSMEDNAYTFKNGLYNLSEPSAIYRTVDTVGKPIYQVKIGPFSSVEKANEILTLLNRQGREATIIVANR